MPRSPEGLLETPDEEPEPGRQNRRPLPRRPSRPHHPLPSVGRPRRTARAPQPSGKRRAWLRRCINQSASSLVGSPAAGGGSYFDPAGMLRLAAIPRLECQTQHSLRVRALGIAMLPIRNRQDVLAIGALGLGQYSRGGRTTRGLFRCQNRSLKGRYRILESPKTSR